MRFSCQKIEYQVGWNPKSKEKKKKGGYKWYDPPLQKSNRNGIL